MTTKDEALKMALEALEFSKSYLDDLADVYGTSKKAKPGSTSWHVDRAIATCREALEQKDEVNHELLEALRWYEAQAKDMGKAAIHSDSKTMLALMREVAVDYGKRARAAIAKATGEPHDKR